MAVSSWNDNGQKQFVNDPSQYYDSPTFQIPLQFVNDPSQYCDSPTFQIPFSFQREYYSLCYAAFCRSTLPLGFLPWAWMDVNKVHLAGTVTKVA